jgi:hypothetical protein
MVHGFCLSLLLVSSSFCRYDYNRLNRTQTHPYQPLLRVLLRFRMLRMPSNSHKRLTQLGTVGPSSQTAALHDHRGGEDRSSGTDLTNSVTDLKHLKLPAALKSRAEASKFVKSESPWKKYEKSHEIRLGDEDRVIVADMKDPWSDDVAWVEQQGPTPYVVTVRSFPSHNGEEKCRMLHRIRHANIVSVREIFSYEGSFHIIFEHMPMSLSHFTGFQKHLNERQLASILRQGSSAMYFTGCLTDNGRY